MIYYIINNEEEITIVGIDQNGKVMFIPADTTNWRYREYIRWVEEGNQAEPYSPA
jgi:hypothetical protein